MKRKIIFVLILSGLLGTHAIFSQPTSPTLIDKIKNNTIEKIADYSPLRATASSILFSQDQFKLFSYIQLIKNKVPLDQPFNLRWTVEPTPAISESASTMLANIFIQKIKKTDLPLSRFLETHPNTNLFFSANTDNYPPFQQFDSSWNTGWRSFTLKNYTITQETIKNMANAAVLLNFRRSLIEPGAFTQVDLKHILTLSFDRFSANQVTDQADLKTIAQVPVLDATPELILKAAALAPKGKVRIYHSNEMTPDIANTILNLNPNSIVAIPITPENGHFFINKQISFTGNKEFGFVFSKNSLSNGWMKKNIGSSHLIDPNIQAGNTILHGVRFSDADAFIDFNMYDEIAPLIRLTGYRYGDEWIKSNFQSGIAAWLLSQTLNKSIVLPFKKEAIKKFALWTPKTSLFTLHNNNQIAIIIGRLPSYNLLYISLNHFLSPTTKINLVVDSSVDSQVQINQIHEALTVFSKNLTSISNARPEVQQVYANSGLTFNKVMLGNAIGDIKLSNVTIEHTSRISSKLIDTMLSSSAGSRYDASNDTIQFRMQSPDITLSETSATKALMPAILREKHPKQ